MQATIQFLNFGPALSGLGIAVIEHFQLPALSAGALGDVLKLLFPVFGSLKVADHH